MARCQDCGATFEQSGQGRPRKFCLECSPRDPAALNRAWRERNREELAARRRRPALAPRVCTECGETFEPGQPRQVYCKRRCYKRAENRRRRERYVHERRERYERRFNPNSRRLAAERTAPEMAEKIKRYKTLEELTPGEHLEHQRTGELPESEQWLEAKARALREAGLEDDDGAKDLESMTPADHLRDITERS